MKPVPKNCGNCLYSCDMPMNMKPMYGVGGMMRVCYKPSNRKKKGIELVAPEHRCRQWLSGKKYNELYDASQDADDPDTNDPSLFPACGDDMTDL